MFLKSYKKINVSSWKRREHFEKWIHFDEPFHGVVVKIDLTKCREFCTENNYKIFHRYMFHFVHALNEIEPMKYRLLEGNPVIFDEVLSGLVVMRPDETFAYGQLVKMDNFDDFIAQMTAEKQRIFERGTLHDVDSELNITHFSVLPWTDFLSLSHARKYGNNDSIPKITFGKITENKGNYSMPMAVHVHHALVDGKDVADFVNLFQEKLQEN